MQKNNKGVQPNSFYGLDELNALGFKSFGVDVKISRFARFYGIENMSIGNHVRIDDFCILSGDIQMGSYIHVSASCLLYGAYGIVLEDYSGLSPRTTIFSASDDFSGESMIGPILPKEYTNVQGAPVIIKKYAQTGAGSILLPGVNMEEGSVCGAMSLITKSLLPWSIYGGIPAQKIKERKRNIEILAKEFESK